MARETYWGEDYDIPMLLSGSMMFLFQFQRSISYYVDQFVRHLRYFDKVMVTPLKRDHHNSAGVWSYFSR